MQLSGRLQRIADFVRPGDRVIDVGTDHAYVPIWLLLHHITESVVATDLRAGPLENALADAAHFGVADRLTLRQCDGLAGCAPDAVDTVVVAGMGGETIVQILSDAPWALDKRLILQPQTKQTLLRDYLAAQGCAIADAALASDMGRIYAVWLVSRGEMPPKSAVEPALLRRRDPLLKPYLDDRIKRLRKQHRGISQAAAPDRGEIARLEEEIAESESIRREVEAWQA